MTALLDTSVLIGVHPPKVGQLEAAVLSAVSVGELEAGVLSTTQAGERAARLRRLGAILAESPVLPVDRLVAARYGELRARTGRLPSNDLWIAATALAHDLWLITADERQAKLPLVRTSLLA